MCRLVSCVFKCVTCVSVEDREGPPEPQHNVQLEQEVEDRVGDEEQRYSGQSQRDGDQPVGLWGRESEHTHVVG